MKKQHTSKPILLSFLMVFFFWSCQELALDPLQNSATELSLQEAQDFYNEIQQKELAVARNSKNDKRSKKASRKAFWDKTEKFKVGNQELISAPILFDDDLNKPGYGFKKMLFYKDTRTGKTDARVLEYILDREYLAKNFGKIDIQTFTGALVVYDADGNYMDGVAVRNGKEVGKVVVALDGEIMQPKKANSRMGSLTCDVVWSASNCIGGGSMIQSGTPRPPMTMDEAKTQCSDFTMQITNCTGDGIGSGPPPTQGMPIVFFPTMWDSFSGFAGGGSGGTYTSPQTYTDITILQLLALEYINTNSWLSNEEKDLVLQDPNTMTVMENYKNPEPGRPQLGWLGNAILSNSGSEFTKDLFQNYWLGKGDFTLSKARFDDVVRVAANCTIKQTSSTTFMGKPVSAHVITFYSSDEYKYALGTATLYYQVLVGAIGVYDEYNFDPKDFPQRDAKAEVITRAINKLSPKTAKPFIIKYP